MGICMLHSQLWKRRPNRIYILRKEPFLFVPVCVWEREGRCAKFTTTRAHFTVS